jgi:hypothetical protein
MGEPLHSEEEDQFPTDKIFEVSENSGHVPPMQNLAFASLLVAYYLNIRDGAPASLQGRELREAVFAAISKRVAFAMLLVAVHFRTDSFML